MELIVLGLAIIFSRMKSISCGSSQFNLSESTITTVPTSGLYGYDISIQDISDKRSMVVGIPPTSPGIGHGNMQRCIISSSASNTTAMKLDCSSIPRPPGLSNDNLGQQFAVNPKTGEIVACSTNSEQICTNTVTLPGFCYRYDATSTRSAWQAIDHSETRGCPVTSTVDVLFILDGSGSVGRNDFEKIKIWTKAVTDKLEIDQGIAKVAVLQFGTNVRREIDFNSYSQLSSLQRAISSISYRGGGTPTVDALNEASDVLKGSNRFGGKSNAQVMIVLTDGGSTQEGVLKAANGVRDLGAITYAVGVGNGIDNAELRELATGTSTNDRVYEVDNFDELGTIVDSLQKQIETFIPTEGAGSLTVELAQAGIGVAVTKNNTVMYKLHRGVYSDGGTHPSIETGRWGVL